MSAAAQRAAFAAIGRDLLAIQGSGGARRALALSAPAADPPAVAFDRLIMVPEWLRWPHDRQAALARAVALRVLAPALAASIDGGWLGNIARIAGEDMLDWAIARGAMEHGGDDGSQTAEAPDDLTAAGFATLRTALPPDLRCYMRAAAATPLAADEAMIADAVAFVGAQAT